MLGAILLLQAGTVLPLPMLLPGFTLRIQASRLMLDEDGKPPKPIESPNDLRGRVRIASDADALSYVRFLRSPGLWPALFKEAVVEIRPQPVVFPVPRDVYSDLRIYTISGWDGVVSDRDWKRLGFSNPKVAGGVGAEWRIRRACLLSKGDSYLIGHLTERVSAEGRYVSEVDARDDAPRGIRWKITRP